MLSIKSIRNMSCLAALIMLASCESSISDLSSSRKTSNVATTEENGIVKATIKASASGNQELVASQSSTVADTSIIFPAGALAVDTEVSIGAAVDRSTTILSENNVAGTLVKAGAPVYIGATDSSATFANPATLSLPLPLSGDNLKLTADSGKLAFVYAVLTTTGWISGIKPLTAADLLGTFLRTDIEGFGYFQIVYLSEKTEAKKAATQVRPAFKDPESAAEPTALPFGCYTASTMVCQRYGANNGGNATEMINHCKENSGSVVSTCPQADFLSSCYYSTNDLKYFFYTGHKNATEADCDSGGGVYSATFSADGN